MKLFGGSRIYLDYAGATPVDPEATGAVVAASAAVGNPGALHREGVVALRSLEASREHIARLFGVKTREIVFTSGGTEANNL
ncbi:MAG: aminotransferase class V-fold PLP-dependent enzyme, partial [Candidatus Paceibacterota bacterium]